MHYSIIWIWLDLGFTSNIRTEPHEKVNFLKTVIAKIILSRIRSDHKRALIYNSKSTSLGSRADELPPEAPPTFGLPLSPCDCTVSKRPASGPPLLNYYYKKIYHPGNSSFSESISLENKARDNHDREKNTNRLSMFISHLEHARFNASSSPARNFFSNNFVVPAKTVKKTNRHAPTFAAAAAAAVVPAAAADPLPAMSRKALLEANSDGLKGIGSNRELQHKKNALMISQVLNEVNAFSISQP